MKPAAIPTLLLTGTVSAGKTVIAIEVGHLLGLQGKPTAVVDLDWLGWLHLRSSSITADQLIARNLAVVWPNLRAAGMRYAVLARVLSGREALDAVQAAVPDAHLTVVRLTASPATIKRRRRSPARFFAGWAGPSERQKGRAGTREFGRGPEAEGPPGFLGTR